MLAIPPVAIGLAAVVFLGPGASRPALGARFYGATTDEPILAVRLLTVTSLYGVEEAVAVPDLRLFERRDGNDRLVWSGASGDDGVAEARFEDKVAPRKLDLILIGRDRVLARGKVERVAHAVKRLG